MHTFGCCSLYEECSNEKKCLRLDNPYYQGCQYRRNLEADNIFYGVNRNVGTDNTKNKPSVINGVYLYCFDRLFKITVLLKPEHSYTLNAEQIQKLIIEFDKLNIPYKTELEDELCIINAITDQDPEPACAFVVFSIGEENFKIANFNSYLIKKKYADLINKALISKEISSHVCCVPRRISDPVQHRPVKIDISIQKNQQLIGHPIKIEVPFKDNKKPPVKAYEQVTINDLLVRC